MIPYPDKVVGVDVSAEKLGAEVTDEMLVISPLLLTEMTGVVVPEPNVPGVELIVASVSGIVTGLVPLNGCEVPVASPEALMVCAVCSEAALPPIDRAGAKPVSPLPEPENEPEMLIEGESDSTTVEPRATVPPPVKPVPAVTVMDELISAPFGIEVKLVPISGGLEVQEGVVPETST